MHRFDLAFEMGCFSFKDMGCATKFCDKSWRANLWLFHFQPSVMALSLKLPNLLKTIRMLCVENNAPVPYKIENIS